MNRVDLYIDGQKVDFFEQESIELTMSVQNVKDISKVFGDFSKSFTLPASPNNNAVFKHYYNVDVSGGFNANTRTDAFIEVNNNVLRSGVVELEGVQLKNLQPHAYKVSFYSKTTALKDLFGEDTLNDLDLSSYDHTYNDTNIVTGLNGYVSGTDSSIIYPLISPVANWYYDSGGGPTSHEPNNISYHNGHNEHGVFYYDLKPAVKLQKILDAIETKYGVTFNSDFFDSADFGKLFMWCHRRAGYMFKDQANGFTPQVINFTQSATGDYDLATQKYTVTAEQEADLRVRYVMNSTDDFKVQIYINDALFSERSHSGNVTNVTIDLGVRDIGDTIQFRFSPPNDWDASSVSINTTTFFLEYDDESSWQEADTVGRLAAQSITSEVVVADQMPEQKVADFLSSLIKMFNLVLVPTSSTAYDVEPLDDWYAEGSTYDITSYTNIEEVGINRPSLYKRVSYSFNETEAILGEEYRLQNDVGYGDLRADFEFDGDEFEVEVGFDHMLFERLSDQNGGALTTIGVGKSITRELEPYIGSPLIFYVPAALRGTDTFSYIDMTDSENSKTDFWLVGNVNSSTAASVTQTINFGTEVDPYLLQGFGQSLYSTYWKDYITDLYDVQRRLFSFRAQLPVRVMLDLKTNDKLTILERNYIINSVTMNLATGEAQLELLNDV
jgi:hypothetical protein